MRRRLCAIAIASSFGDGLAGQATHWTPQLRWTAGTLNSNVEFQSVAGAAVGPRRQLAVVDRKAANVIILDSLGRKKVVAGRDGDGPGEFRTPSAAGVLGDTIWVSDIGTRRLTFFSFDGKLRGTLPLSQAGGGEAVLSVGSARGILSNGRIVGIPGGEMGTPTAGANPDERRGVPWAGRDGVFRDTLFSYRRGHYVLHPTAGRFISYQPFNDGDLWGVSPNGQRVVIVDRTVRPSQSSASFRISSIDPNGARTWRDVAYTPVSIPKAILESTFDSAMRITNRMYESAKASGRGRVPPAVTRDEMRQALFLPRHYPPVTDLAFDLDGSLWLRREATDAKMIDWDRVSAAGVRLGSIKLPTAEGIVAAQFPYIWVSAKGQDDEPLIRLYELKRP